MRCWVGAAFAAASIASAHAETVPVDGVACQAAMTSVERGTGLPTHLLEAIGVVESGRVNKGSGTVASWPWTINVAGTGYFFASKTEAVAAVVAAQASGVRSIDVGCMQINLQYHPLAFSGLDEAFDPAANVRYGAAFLQRLYGATGSWGAAIAAYHSSTPDVGQDYSRRVAAVWPLAAAYALSPRVASAGMVVAIAAKVRPPEVDPYHVATPEFRARLLEEAAFRHTRDNSMGLSQAERPTATVGPRAYADAEIQRHRR